MNPKTPDSLMVHETMNLFLTEIPYPLLRRRLVAAVLLGRSRLLRRFGLRLDRTTQQRNHGFAFALLDHLEDGVVGRLRSGLGEMPRDGVERVVENGVQADVHDGRAVLLSQVLDVRPLHRRLGHDATRDFVRDEFLQAHGVIRIAGEFAVVQLPQIFLVQRAERNRSVRFVGVDLVQREAAFDAISEVRLAELDIQIEEGPEFLGCTSFNPHLDALRLLVAARVENASGSEQLDVGQSLGAGRFAGILHQLIGTAIHFVVIDDELDGKLEHRRFRRKDLAFRTTLQAQLDGRQKLRAATKAHVGLRLDLVL